MALQSIDIWGFNSGAQIKNKKPFLLSDDAFQRLENAYVFREELKKREGIQLIGRFRREIPEYNAGTTTLAATSDTVDLYATSTITETYAEIEPGSISIEITGGNAANAATYVDNGDGTFTVTGNGDASNSYIDYINGTVQLGYLVPPIAAASDIMVTFFYYPSLPAMGIWQKDQVGINDELTLWFDTKYCYINTNGDFVEYIPGTTWAANDYNFFWATNYRGNTPEVRLLFTTNFINDANNPIRYTNGSTWSDLIPILSQTGGAATRVFLTQARILIPYYGRLLALNVYETDADGMGNPNYASTRNIFNRCRYSQIGDPTDTTNSWRSDVFGRGGFVDAPTNEEIVSATFFKNTLIVQFERSTWRLQYLGEYGSPFLWERISSDFGGESTFSTVLFDNGVLAVGDKAIVVSNSNDVQRMDLQIPDTVFTISNQEHGVERVQGIRDFQKEVVYWCYPDSTKQQIQTQYFPNWSILFNYRNNTFAFFRNSVTCFGNFQYQENITWDRTDVFWDSELVTWDSQDQIKMPLIVSGNQQGFAHFYGYADVETQSDSTISAMDQESLSVRNVTVGATVVIESINHNLSNGEFIYLTGLIYTDTTTDNVTVGSTTLNDRIYLVTVIDKDTFYLNLWDQATRQFYSNFTVTNVGDYMGGGVCALFPNPYIETKDFNPLKQPLGQNVKTSYIDFLFDANSPSPMGVILKSNTTLDATGNILIGNKSIEQANSKTGFIFTISQSNPCVITSLNHGLLNGDIISPQQISGMTELNGNQYTVTFINTNTFSINTDSTGFNAYQHGGYWEQTQQEYFTLSANYSWHRFFAGVYGQFFSLILTHTDEQMSQLCTHQQNFALNAMKIWVRPGGKNVFGK